MMLSVYGSLIWLFALCESQILCKYECNESHQPGYCQSSCPMVRYDQATQQNCSLYGQQILNSQSQCIDYQINNLQESPRCTYHCTNNDTFPTFCIFPGQVCALSIGPSCDIYGDPVLYPSHPWCNNPPTSMPSGN